MQQLNVCKWKMNLGGGFRYLSIGQDYNGVVTHPIVGYIETLDIHHRFNGVGPTVFAELRRPFDGSGLAFVSNLRGSFLFGSTDVRTEQTSTFGAGASTIWNSPHGGDTRSVGELQVGGEWSRDLNGCATLVVQALWEAQYWPGTGNAFNPRNDDLGLMGFTLQAAITR